MSAIYLARKFRLLGWPDRVRIIKAIVLLVMTRAALGVLTFSTVVRIAERLGTRAASRAPTPELLRMAWAVEAMGNRLFPRNPCLTNAIVVHVLLRRSGCHSKLRIGVKKDSERTLRAHAWVEIGSVIVIGGAESAEYLALPHFSPVP
jgi:hypothetical protein